MGDKMSDNSIIIEDEWRLYMYLLRCAIWAEKPEEDIMNKYMNVSANSLIEKAKDRAQRLLLQKYIQIFADYKHEELEDSYNGELFAIIKKYEFYKNIRIVLEAAKDRGITLVVFKGCVLADLYPEYVRRYSCDTDFFVSREQNAEAVSLIESLGYEINEHSNAEVTVFYNQEKEHTIELHTCLWEDYEGRQLDILESFNLTDPDSFINITACGIDVTTLGYENHLIYQIFHIIKHFSLEGIGLKYLADITLYVSKYGEKIDMEHFWKCMDELSYTKFAYSLFVLCVEFLNMDATILKFRNISYGNEMIAFFRDFLCGGEMYADKTASWQIMGMMTPYFTGQRGTGDSSIRRKLELIFPKASDLPDELSYAKKVKILLPIAWIHKMINYLIKYHRNKSTWYTAGEKLDVAEHRLKLMKDMGLI